MSRKKKKSEKPEGSPSGEIESSPANPPVKSPVILGEPPKRRGMLVLSSIGFAGWMCFLVYVAIKVVFA